MAERKGIRIDSERDLRANAITIRERVNKDERGGLLFLLNPIFALEEADVKINPAMRRHIRRALRYGTSTKTRLQELEKEITRLASHKVNVTSNVEVARLLFEELKLPISAPRSLVKSPQKSPEKPSIYEAEEEPLESEDTDYTSMTVSKLKVSLRQRELPITGKKNKLIARLTADSHSREQTPTTITPEIVESLREKHPVVPVILEMRQLLQTGWRFVNRETYEKVKSGSSVTLLRRVRFH